MKLAELRARGFDASTRIAFTKHCCVRCSHCAVIVINGVPAHEHGCPNAMHECKGCNALIPERADWCADCDGAP